MKGLSVLPPDPNAGTYTFFHTFTLGTSAEHHSDMLEKETELLLFLDLEDGEGNVETIEGLGRRALM